MQLVLYFNYIEGTSIWQAIWSTKTNILLDINLGTYTIHPPSALNSELGTSGIF